MMYSTPGSRRPRKTLMFRRHAPSAEHSVQFYVQDRSLVGSVASFLCRALGRGESALVIATPEHRQGIAAGLQARGVDPASARESGRYVELDAAETLATITTDGKPDPNRFSFVEDILGRLRAVSRGEHNRVAIFGEMVSLLCARAEPEAALQLEQLWNKFAKTFPITLFCGYAADSFDRAAHAEVFQKICAEHTDVLPEESYLDLENDEDRRRYVAELQQKARALETEMEARRQSEDALVRSEKHAAVGRLTASIAHEINNPLSSLTNLFYLINTDTSLDPAARHYAALADQELRRTARITKQMLGFYRESSTPIPCKLSLIVDSVLELFEPRLCAANITVEKDYAAEGNVEGFPAEMRQLFANLMIVSGGRWMVCGRM